MLVDLDVAEYCTMCLHSSELHTLFGESLLAKGPILKGIKLKRDPEVGPTRLPKKICVYVRLLCLLGIEKGTKSVGQPLTARNRIQQHCTGP